MYAVEVWQGVIVAGFYQKQEDTGSPDGEIDY
jgi:hypothetical protein